MILNINPDNPQPRLISQAVECLRRGGVICYPTDTVYGIGCDIFNQKAIKRIYQIKRRPKTKPFSFMCSSLKNVSDYCYISNSAYRIMKKNLPGAYTFILPAAKIVPKILTTKQKTVGIRVPDNNICRELIEALGNPILTTSAVTEDEDRPLSEAFEIEDKLGRQVDFVIDGGSLFPEPSSIISLVEDYPVVLRNGKGDIGPFI
ncbi:MAG: threonylcarbamoyl-AMP synthase [Proteobacteria bacterium]|nr:threonylcarbamoyl-AMP synthase [Pseudomonadota bacterium]MBU1709742.1 threonylcarbamoyl-AMP synthase [Pseudomonadota bacterium]